MGMSTYVVGYIKADDTWNKMKQIWDSCTDANVEIPDEVLEFFDHEPPGNLPGREVDISEAVTEYKDDMKDGYDVEIYKLPPSIHVVRVYNSY